MPHSTQQRLVKTGDQEALQSEKCGQATPPSLPTGSYLYSLQIARVLHGLASPHTRLAPACESVLAKLHISLYNSHIDITLPDSSSPGKQQ